MQRTSFRMLLALGKVELAALEGPPVAGIGKAGSAFGSLQTVELAEKLLPPLAHQFGKIDVVVGKKEERGRSGEFLALEKHGSAGSKQEEGRQRAVPPGRGEPLHAQPLGRVGYLVVVLQKRDEAHGRHVPGGRAAAAALPRVPLALVKISPFHGRNHFLRRALVIAVVKLVVARGRHPHHVMEVVVPDGIQAVSAFRGTSYQARLLELVLADHAASCGLAPLAARDA